MYLGLGSLLALVIQNLPFYLQDTTTAESRCLDLESTLNIENTTILNVAYVRGDTRVQPQGTCAGEAHVSVSLCRVQYVTHTSARSAIHAEAWLPDEWYGRFLVAGNGGLGGCIPYNLLDYGSSMHFATIAADNGHDGYTAVPFLHNDQVLQDFATRSIHIASLTGKEILRTYYARPHAKSYFLGCSTGGRQGTYSAVHHAENFDGILAGAPGTDWNHLMHWMGMLARAVGAPNASKSASFIPPELWRVVAEEVMAQCDGLDGLEDGMISEPDECGFRPEVLLCGGARGNKECLTPAQVDALRTIYSPLYDAGQLVYPRFDPGSEGVGMPFTGEFPELLSQWFKYGVINATSYDFSTYGPAEGRLMDSINAGGIATWDGNMSAFRDRGGKYLTYHGQADWIVPAGNSKRQYSLVSSTMGLSTPEMDSFYRLFLAPGMAHCLDGPGAWDFGQLGHAEAVTLWQSDLELTMGLRHAAAGNVHTPVRNDSAHNILLALVDWVEGGMAPETITGTGDDGVERAHCRYPAVSMWDEESEEWQCVM
ncbi:tannase and feruloyl esterase [Roridomyces roridus]|uniref:Carboxylic ester hydrolase n=1 Tax=Roridomyces roridus TaxID=1738132 RepID=A0AAD7FFS2_9AGAR|nr:tannase and feruloyl esterase [Roridomyces roridus]